MSPLHAANRSLDNMHLADLLERMASAAERTRSTKNDWLAAAHLVRKLEEDVHELFERVGPGDVASAVGLPIEVAAAMFEAAATGTIAALPVNDKEDGVVNDDDDEPLFDASADAHHVDEHAESQSRSV